MTFNSPLKHFKVVAPMRIGVLGIGGLGHLAIQFAVKKGCHVVALSLSGEKEVEAKMHGAEEFVWIEDINKLNFLNRSLDFILSTVKVDLDWEKYMALFRPNGKLCFVGAPEKPLTLPIYRLLHGRKSICGSPIGSRADMNEMLQFAADHHIQAQTDVVAFA